MMTEDKSKFSSGIQDLTAEEVDLVNGAGKSSGALAIGAAAGIGAATFGSSWGAIGVTAAFAAAPLAVIGMGALVAFGVYTIWNQK